MAKAGVPKPLGAGQIDPVSGQLYWPGPLQEESFAAQRGDVDQLVATQARYGALNYEDQMKLRKIILAMYDQLKSQITQIPPQDYSNSRSFSEQDPIRHHQDNPVANALTIGVHS